jgi:inhibitor of KinA sporulation pathway (predicted exonuclease)
MNIRRRSAYGRVSEISIGISSKECRLKNVPYPFGSRHINAKTLFAIKHRLAEEIGIDKALALLGMELIGTHHRGVDDAYNAARIVYTII